MNSKSRLSDHVCLWLVVLSCLSLYAGVALGDDKAIFEKAFAHWKARRAALKTLDVSGKGKVVFPKGAWTGEEGFPQGVLPPEPLEVERSQRFVIDFQTTKTRIETVDYSIYMKDATLQQQRTTRVFDGNEMRTFYHDVPGQPDVWTNVRMQIEESDHWLLVPFGCVGIRGNVALRTMLEHGFDELQPHRLDRLGDTPCAVFRTVEQSSDFKMFSEYWVDPARDSVIVRYTNFFPNENPHMDVYYQYERVETGDPILQWRLSSVECKDFRVGVPEITVAGVRLLDSMTVRINEPIDEALFDMEIKPGMSVYDVKIGRRLPGPAAAGVARLSRPLVIVLICSGAALLLLLGLGVWRRRRIATDK